MELRPDIVERFDAASALLDAGDLAQAESILRGLVAEAPQLVAVHNLLGIVLRLRGRLEDAIESYRSAHKLDPSDGRIVANIANIHADLRETQMARDTYRRALALDPDLDGAHSNLIYHLAYTSALSPEDLLAESVGWYARHGAAHAQSAPVPADRSPDRILKIGYLSADLKQHTVVRFLEPVLRSHDRATVRPICYQSNPDSDDATAALRQINPDWREVHSASDEELVAQIRADGIDIMVELSGHTAGNRLKALSRRAAPVQVTYLSYFATTGVPQIDYLITDSVLHPADTTDRAVEQLWRLPGSWLCYNPWPEAPDVVPPPSLSGTPPTFGSFSDLRKVGPEIVKLWAAVLSACPESRLLIKDRFLGSISMRKRLMARLAEQQIATDRILLAPYSPSRRDHLAAYGSVDVILDTWPCTGGTTTCDALWMGVPIVTFAGDVMVQRLSASMLAAAGLTHLIARTPAEYVGKAVSTIRDQEARSRLRGEQRERVALSPLCDAQGHARALEQAYRGMWHRYVATH